MIPKSFLACLKIRTNAVSVPKPVRPGTTREHGPSGCAAEEQQCETGLGAKTFRRRPLGYGGTSRAAALLPLGFVLDVVTARHGHAPTAPPRPRPESPAAAPFPLFRQLSALPCPKAGPILQPVQQLLVCRRENERCQFFTAHPKPGGASDCLGLAAFPLGQKKPDVNPLFRVGMGDLRQTLARLDLYSQFLSDFADQTVLERLTRLPFSTRKFPIPGQMRTRRTLGDQQSAPMKYQGGCNLNGLGNPCGDFPSPRPAPVPYRPPGQSGSGLFHRPMLL